MYLQEECLTGESHPGGQCGQPVWFHAPIQGAGRTGREVQEQGVGDPGLPLQSGELTHFRGNTYWLIVRRNFPSARTATLVAAEVSTSTEGSASAVVAVSRESDSVASSHGMELAT